ncbi:MULTISPECIES: ABC transporter permease [Spirulina sp. CCY15215]|uniref:ABC transporter permease n=1 Tax=Spirulina sp. CCY15215 TaxID=2767591 RepID=UPI00194FB1A1|nr:ABC transporter permease [Spirulina major]
MNVGRILAIAGNGFRETLRDRVLYFLGIFALFLGIAKRWLPEVAAATETKMFIDLGLGTIAGCSAIAAIFVATNLINKEIEKRTLLTILSKPVSRAEFIVGKHLGLWGIIGAIAWMMSIVYWVMLAGDRHDFLLVNFLIILAFLFLELGVLIAAALMFGTFTNSLVAVMLSLGVYLMGHGSKDLVALGKLSENAQIESISKNLYLILPDLSRLNFRNEAVYNLLPPASELLTDALYALVYMILFLAIAILIFSRRQF